MQTVDELHRQLGVTEGLRAVVKTMKVLAAASILQYEEAVRAYGAYFRTIELGFQVVLGRRTDEEVEAVLGGEPGVRAGIVVFGSGQGLCGRFNEQIAGFADGWIRRQGVTAERVLVVGEQAIGPLEGAGYRVGAEYPVPGSIGGIRPSVQDLALELEAWRRERVVGRILLFHNRPRPGMAFTQHVQQLIPLERKWLLDLRRRPWPTHVLPAFSMDAEQLFAALVRQYLFISLYRALAESLAAEHAARLSSMQAAEKNIDERLEQLRALYRRTRQHLVTEEVLEIMAAFDAQGGEAPAPAPGGKQTATRNPRHHRP